MAFKLATSVVKRWAAQGEKWDAYGAEWPQEPLRLDIIHSGYHGIFTHYTVQIEEKDADGKLTVRTIDKSGIDFYHLYRALSLDLRFFQFPSPAKSLAVKQAKLRDFLMFLSVRNLSPGDRAIVDAFLQEKVKGAPETPRGTGDPAVEEGPANEPEHQHGIAEEETDELLEHKTADDGSDHAIGRRESEAELQMMAQGMDALDKDKPLFRVPDVSNPEGVKVIDDVVYREVSDEEKVRIKHDEDVEAGIAGTDEEKQTMSRWGSTIMDKDKLDIYKPLDDNGEEKNAPGGLPVVIHIHGGGWVRGDRKEPFRGAPSFCIAYARAGYVAVAPSYRLSDAPNHMRDCQEAVQWVIANIQKYGGNPKIIFISGHSAGGNIASMLAISQEFGVLPNPAIKGVICTSGVYNAFGPMPTSLKNTIFRRLYIYNTFGHGPNKKVDKAELLKHSPSEILRMKVESGKKSIKIRNLSCAGSVKKSAQELKDQTKYDLPPFFVTNASWDLGLEMDGVEFSILLQRYGADVRYETIPNSTHIDICWDKVLEKKIAQWLKMQLKKLEAEADASV